MNELKTKIRSCETAVFNTGLVLAVVLIFVAATSGQFYYSALAGYFLGFASFATLAESYAAFDKFPPWIGALSLLASNLKLIFLGAVIFLLYKFGFSVGQMGIGLILSQLAMLFAFFRTLHRDRKSAEMNKKN